MESNQRVKISEDNQVDTPNTPELVQMLKELGCKIVTTAEYAKDRSKSITIDAKDPQLYISMEDGFSAFSTNDRLIHISNEAFKDYVALVMLNSSYETLSAFINSLDPETVYVAPEATTEYRED